MINLSTITGFNELLHNGVETNILKINKVECSSQQENILFKNVGNNNNKTEINTEDVNNEDIDANKNQNVYSNKYKVIKYDKNMLSADLVLNLGLCRSIIVNSKNEVVSFSPPKTIGYEEFISKYELPNDEIFAEEFVEGTMINVFWDSSIGLSGGWEIATRNTVGANSSFYKNNNINSNKSSNKTFRTMFLEAAKANNFHLSYLNPDLCYSFVLQHPENRIVVPFKHPELYLVRIYSIDNTDKNNIMVYSHGIDHLKQLSWYKSTVRFPKEYTFDSYDELKEKYASMNTPYHLLGVVIYNKVTGERTKLRNPVYEQVRTLRGNQPKLQYQYLSLRKEGNVSEFLKFYPEHKKCFSQFRDQLHLFTNTLFSNYISCYVRKERPLKEFSDHYRTHMFNIHQKFINELREQKLFVTNTVVIKYVNELHPSLLMYCLNYNMRKRAIDFAVDENQL